MGFDNAGFKNVFSVEYDTNAAKTYQRNFPNHLLLNQDIKTISNEDLIRLKGDQEVDVIIGGPPCQGFSLAGNIGRKFIEDERNYLFKEFVRFVELVNPKMFVMENVARLATHNKGETLKEVVSAFETFPDNFIFEGTSISIQQQIGNAVPVELAKVVAQSVLSTLKKFEYI